MDPRATIHRYNSALADQDFDEALHALRDLSTWLRGGGFAPRDWHLELEAPGMWEDDGDFIEDLADEFLGAFMLLQANERMAKHKHG